jgi:hypothetical protein
LHKRRRTSASEQLPIADLTGLTPVHVCCVMTDFRHAGMMRLSRCLITIAKVTELQRVARLMATFQRVDRLAARSPSWVTSLHTRRN